MQVSETPKIYRHLLNCCVICVLIGAAGGGMAFLGYIAIGQVLVGFAAIAVNACIIIFWLLKIRERIKQGKNKD
jgi:hypothetical protein